MTDDGGASVTERGVVYAVTSTNGNPEIGGTGVTNLTTSAATGVFAITTISLSPSKDYSFKAYATNAAGTSYSSVATFSTLPTIEISDAVLVEGNAGTTNMVFTVTLSAPSPQTVTVSAAPVSMSATLGSDFTVPVTTTITFVPSVTSQPFSVPILGDTAVESNEVFAVELSAATNGVIVRGSIGRITNDDGTPPSRVFVSIAGDDSNLCSDRMTPCRNLDAAVGQVAIDGEVIVMDTGEYNSQPMIVGKGVKITSPAGQVAFVRHPITVNAPGGWVALTGLTLKGVDASTGLWVAAADSLSIEETHIGNWGIGLHIETPSPTEAVVSIINSVFAANSMGIVDSAAATNRLSVTETRFEGNFHGLMVGSSRTSVRQSLFTGNRGAGILMVSALGSVDVRQSEFWGNDEGIRAFFGTLRISGSHVFGNVTGLSADGGSTFMSSGTNGVRGNGTDTIGTISLVPEQ